MESKLSELRLDAKELKTVLESVSRPKVKDLLTLDLRKLETDIIQIEDALKSSQSSSSSSGPKSVGIVPNSLSVKAYDVQIKNYSWEDAEETVKIYIMNLKDVTSLSKPGDILCEFTKNSVHLRINNLGGKNHVFTLKETSELIDPEKSSYKLKSDMVILTLAKAGSTGKWEKLTMSEKRAAEQKAEKFKPPGGEETGVEDSQSSLMNMMKSMYEQGDDEMKRTILKSFSEGMKNQ